ncbi:hypothetical protein D3C77_425490 [compost metagenome]
MLPPRRHSNFERTLEDQGRAILIGIRLLIMRLIIRYRRVIYHRGMYGYGVYSINRKTYISPSINIAAHNPIINGSCALLISLVRFANRDDIPWAI